MQKRTLIPSLLALFAPLAGAQGTYDFDALNGSDPHPFTLLDGQDGWSEETFNAANRLGVTATLSHDGTQSLQFQEVGPGYGCDASRINDAAWGYPAFNLTENNAYFQADVKVGFWGGSFGLAHDTDGSGNVRGSQTGELGVRFTIGTQANVQLKLRPASGAATTVPLTVGGGQWVRVRVVMDLTALSGAGTGTVFLQNLTAGETTFTQVAGLTDVPLGLNPTAADASNAATWDAVWLHFEGATYGLDNMEVGNLDPGLAYCPANTNSTGVPGVLRATGSDLVAQNALTLVAQDLPASSFGFFLTSRVQANIPNPAGSQGVLCLGGSIGRYVGPGQIQNSGASGSFSLALDLTSTPTPTGLVAVASGETWNFQAWYRDAVSGAATSNFTNGLQVDFR